MTKPFDSYRGEIVRLYIEENKTLEVVMSLMRTRHRFTASRRSYMDNFKKWGVRKYKRKVVVHNQADGAEHDADDECQGRAGHGGGGRSHSLSASSASPEDPAPLRAGAQSLVLPYHRDHAPAASFASSPPSAPAFPAGPDLDQQHPQTGVVHDFAWGYFASSHWPGDEASCYAPYAVPYAAGGAPQHHLGPSASSSAANHQA